ncbi:MAG: glycosyltransferase [Opitutaceae bacterium]|nr:glycosyltransferase [Opitutaceae bacterium]
MNPAGSSPSAAAEAPKVSVITLFHQRRALARDYLEAWERERASIARDAEWLFGDSASTDGTRELLVDRAARWAHVETYENNIGFARGNNALASRARGEILLFLNYDIGFTPGWLAALLRSFEGRPGLGIVGNVQLSVRSRQPDHAGIFFTADGSPFHYRPGLDQLARIDLFPVPAVTGACLAIRRDLFTALGGFHEGYRTSYEDIELCVQARRRGAEIAVATRSVIWHYIGASPGRQNHEETNAGLFRDRCGAAACELAQYAPPNLASVPHAVAADRPTPATDEAETIQIYLDAGHGFTEAGSEVHLVRRGRWNRIEIALPRVNGGSAHQIRLDPGNQPGRVRLGGAAVKVGPTRATVAVWRSRDLAAVAQVSGSARRVEDPRGLSLESTGDDPQIIFPIAGPLRDAPAEATLAIWLWLERRPGAAVVSSARRRPAPSWRDVFARRRILADLTRLSPGGLNGGVKVFVFELLEAVARRRRFRLSVQALASPEVCREIATAAPAVIARPVSAVDAPEAAALAAHAHVLYAPLGFSPLSRPDLPQVSLLVDFLHRDIPGALPAAEVAAREKWMVETLSRSRVVQCNSRFVVDRLHHHYGHPAADLLVVYNAVGQSMSPLREPHSAAAPYFLYPANDWPHKNHERLIEAYARYREGSAAPWHLRLSGHFAEPDRIHRAIAERGLADCVHILGHLPGAEFSRVFAAAGGLVFPSRYEGFGIPVLEAFRLGVPVICSRAASLPEVGGDACGYFDPDATEALVEAMHRLAMDTAWRTTLVAAGRARARAFDLAIEADKLADTFLALASKA